MLRRFRRVVQILSKWDVGARKMELNEQQYKYFNTTVWAFNMFSLTESELIDRLNSQMGNYAVTYCEKVKKGEAEPSHMSDFLLKVHAEYEAILKKMEAMEGAKKE